MVWQRICFVMLAGALASMLALPLRAEDEKKGSAEGSGTGSAPAEKGSGSGELVPAPVTPAPAPGGVVVPAPIPAHVGGGEYHGSAYQGGSCGDSCGSCCQKYKTVCCEEWVKETHMCKKTCYRTECHDEPYTYCKTQCTPETRTRCITVNRMVPECRDEVRCFSVCVPYTEHVTCYETRTVCKQVCTMERRCVDRGHWECREVECKKSCFDGLRDRFSKCNKCNSGCDDCCNTCCEAPRTKTVKCWVSCKVWEEYPCTKTVKSCEQYPVTKCVTKYRHESRQEVIKVTSYKCVPETRTECYTVMVPHTVTCQGVRKVSVCVPYEVEVPVTRCVKHVTYKQVPCNDCCETTCCKSKFNFNFFRGCK